MTGNRKYQDSHPWITFQHAINSDSPRLWIELGEAASKIEHLAGSPLLEEARNNLHRLYLAKGVLATTAIEGNTLSEEQVLQLLDGKLELPKSQKYLADEVDNILHTCNRLVEELKNNKLPILSSERIKEFNAEVLDKCPLDEGIIAGDYRRHSVVVGRYQGAPAEDCPYLLDKLCSWLNGDAFKAPDGLTEFELPLAILKAVLAHLYIAWIHPFGDGNGRTARLVELQILLEAGAPTPAVHLLSNHYNKTRDMYYLKLKEASQSYSTEKHKISGHHVLPFLEYAIQGFVDGLREQINLVKDQHLNLTWAHVINQRIRGGTPTDLRRRHLVQALTKANKMLTSNEIQQLDATLVFAYAGKTAKTLHRDLNALVGMGLVAQVGRKYIADTESVLAFLPARKQKSKQ